MNRFIGHSQVVTTNNYNTKSTGTITHKIKSSRSAIRCNENMISDPLLRSGRLLAPLFRVSAVMSQYFVFRSRKPESHNKTYNSPPLKRESNRAPSDTMQEKSSVLWRTCILLRPDHKPSPRTKCRSEFYLSRIQRAPYRDGFSRIHDVISQRNKATLRVLL
jgi:hypothetical protein